MTEPSKPDAEGFARSVLWHLAGLRSEIHQLKQQLGSLWQIQTGKDGAELVNLFEEETGANQKMIYQDALKEAGLADHEGGTSDRGSLN